jgi:hypothetical protein
VVWSDDDDTRSDSCGLWSFFWHCWSVPTGTLPNLLMQTENALLLDQVLVDAVKALINNDIET